MLFLLVLDHEDLPRKRVKEEQEREKFHPFLMYLLTFKGEERVTTHLLFSHKANITALS